MKFITHNTYVPAVGGSFAVCGGVATEGLSPPPEFILAPPEIFML